MTTLRPPAPPPRGLDASPAGDPRARPAPPPAVGYRGGALRAAKCFADGTHRTVPPEETLDRIRPHFATGGITRLADVTGLDRIGVHTTIVYRPNSPTLSNSAGKGLTPVAATVSGAMEALELYHAENVRLPVRRASYADLAARGPVLDRERLTLTRASLFSERRAEHWVEGWDLIGQQPLPVPFASAAMIVHPDERPRYWMPFPVTSNGLASGNHLLEAGCAALLEVIERDAIACHVRARRVAGRAYPKVDLDTVGDPTVCALLERFAAAQTGVVLYDVAVDTDVPVYVATLYDRRDRHVGMYGGYGAHLDPAVAMLRALTEAAQSRLTYIAGSRDDFFRHEYLAHRIGDGADEVRQLEEAPATVDARRRRSCATATFEGDMGVLLARLAACGLSQAALVDLTHDEIGVPVARVVVPGLESYPYHPHYAPGARARAFAEAAVLDAQARDGGDAR